MAYCPNCGAEVQGRFCAKCGASVEASAPSSPPGGGYAPPPGGAYAPPPGGAYAPQSPQPMASSTGMADNLASALCYVLGLITGILFLVLAPYNQNKTVRFHAFQSIFFHVGTIAIWIALIILSSILHYIPIVGAILSLLLFMVFGFGVFITWLVLMYKAYNNDRLVLPIVGPLAEKQA